MYRLTSVRVKRIRSLQDTGYISLKPITILVGKNSSGKSSFARIFPLLKQSAERRKSSPILWYGRLVDFGAFEDVVSSFATEKNVELGFKFSVPDRISPPLELFRGDQTAQTALAESIEVVLQLGEGNDGRTRLSSLSLNVYGVEVAISLANASAESIKVNGHAASAPPNSRLLWTFGAILPQLRLQFTEPIGTTDSESYASLRRRTGLGFSEALTALSAFVHGNTNLVKKLELVRALPITDLSTFLRVCRSQSGVSDTWKNAFANTSLHDPALSRLHRAVVFLKLSALLGDLDAALAAFCEGTNYLEPLRASAQRYYRREEISTDELDPKGLNTAFFIQSLRPVEKANLNEWLSEAFGFVVDVKPEHGHLSLVIASSLDQEHPRNMADVGLGFSQFLPVALQLFAAKNLRRSPTLVTGSRFIKSTRSPYDSSPFVVIEQPELHLHPAFQAGLADVFVASVNPLSTDPQNKVGVRIVAETHSSTLIGRLGELVNAGKVASDLIGIVVFEEDEQSPGASKVRVANFNEEGILRNWPIGFFED